ncbi:hypothetical protein PR048_022469 [Dryococelus australis]|uniref:Uncharacterized protein n=1 Tax=Dryococelus australis TaxID=614101 RepID=A0ABQ9H165_9NEOP|nr:hypothetical protein PR048_022469 [Dryococelus australis]
MDTHPFHEATPLQDKGNAKATTFGRHWYYTVDKKKTEQEYAIENISSKVIRLLRNQAAEENRLSKWKADESLRQWNRETCERDDEEEIKGRLLDTHPHYCLELITGAQLNGACLKNCSPIKTLGEKDTRLVSTSSPIREQNIAGGTEDIRTTSVVLRECVSAAEQDKIDVQHVYTEVTFAIGLQLIGNAQNDSEPIADLHRNKHRVPYYQVWGNTGYSLGQQPMNTQLRLECARCCGEQSKERNRDKSLRRTIQLSITCSGRGSLKLLSYLPSPIVKRSENVEHDARQTRHLQLCLIHLVRLLSSHQGEPSSMPGLVTPGFSQVGIVPDDAAGRRIISEISCFPRPCIPALLHSHLISASSALKTSLLRDYYPSLSHHTPPINPVAHRKRDQLPPEQATSRRERLDRDEICSRSSETPENSSACWSLSCVFIGCCSTPGIYGIRKVFPCKSAIGSEACRAGLINCDRIAKLGSPLVDNRPITNARKYRVVSGVLWTNRKMVSSNTDTNRTGVLAVVDTVHSCQTSHKDNSHQGDAGSIPGRFTPDFRMWGSMPLIGWFPRRSHVSPVLSFRSCFIPASITLIVRVSLPVDSEELDVKIRPNLFTHSLTHSQRQAANSQMKAANTCTANRPSTCEDAVHQLQSVNITRQPIVQPMGNLATRNSQSDTRPIPGHRSANHRKGYAHMKLTATPFRQGLRRCSD